MIHGRAGQTSPISLPLYFSVASFFYIKPRAPIQCNPLILGRPLHQDSRVLWAQEPFFFTLPFSGTRPRVPVFLIPRPTAPHCNP